MGAAIQDPEGPGPITTVVTRTVRPGCEREYEAWLHGVGEAAHRFPGHLGIDILRPREPGGRDYVLLFRFSSVDQLRTWEDSDERRLWVSRADALCEGAAEVQRLTGLEGWFTLPGRPLAAPSRWRMAVVSWLAAFPLIQLLNLALPPLLKWAPPLLRGALVGAAMIALMTYVVMPRLTRLFARFLFPKR